MNIEQVRNDAIRIRLLLQRSGKYFTPEEIYDIKMFIKIQCEGL